MYSNLGFPCCVVDIIIQTSNNYCFLIDPLWLQQAVMLFHDTCRCQCFQNFALTTVYLFLMSLARSSMSTARHILTKISLKPHL